MKRVVSITTFVILMTALGAAQDSPKVINGGILNGKAISLPKPPYPAAAKAVGVSGSVTVQVLIDENGDVVSATAVSGHPLLRAASVEAAQGAKFSPTKLSGIPVKVSGVITYNFVGPLSLIRVAFILAHAEKSTSFLGRYSTPEFLASQLPASWIEEKEILNSLTFEQASINRAKSFEKGEEKTRGEIPGEVSTPQVEAKNRYAIKGDINYSSTGSPTTFGLRRLDAKSVASLQRLISLVEARACVTESAAWGHELGIALGTVVAEIENAGKFESNLAIIESLVEKAPSTIVPSSLQRVKDYVNTVRSGHLNREGLISQAEMLANLRY